MKVTLATRQVRTWKCKDLGLESEPWRFAFHPDYSIAAVGDQAGHVVVWSLQRSAKHQHRLALHKNWVSSIAFSPKEPILASGALDGSVFVTDLRNGSTHRVPVQMDWVSGLAFCPCGALLAVVGGESALEVWDVKNCSLMFASRDRIPNPNSVAFSCGGRFLAVGGGEHEEDDAEVYLGEVCLWEVPSGQVRAHLRMGGLCVDALAFDPADRWLGCGCYGKVYLWSVAEHRLVCEYTTEGWSTGLCFLPADLGLAGIEGIGSLRLWSSAGSEQACERLRGVPLGIVTALPAVSLWVGCKTLVAPRVWQSAPAWEIEITNWTVQK